MILNIQEKHGPVYFGGGHDGFSVSFEHTQTYIGQVLDVEKKTKESRVSHATVVFQVKSSFLTQPLLALVWKIPGFTSLPPPFWTSELDCKHVNISYVLTSIAFFGNMAFVQLFTHSLTHSTTNHG